MPGGVVEEGKAAKWRRSISSWNTRVVSNPPSLMKVGVASWGKVGRTVMAAPEGLGDTDVVEVGHHQKRDYPSYVVRFPLCAVPGEALRVAAGVAPQ